MWSLCSELCHQSAESGRGAAAWLQPSFHSPPRTLRSSHCSQPLGRAAAVHTRGCGLSLSEGGAARARFCVETVPGLALSLREGEWDWPVELF